MESAGNKMMDVVTSTSLATLSGLAVRAYVVKARVFAVVSYPVQHHDRLNSVITDVRKMTGSTCYHIGC